MALDIGWEPDTVYESFWIHDKAFFDDVPEERDADGNVIKPAGKRSRIPEANAAAWWKDGDASHLRAFIKQGPMDVRPDRITFRALKFRERACVEGIFDLPPLERMKRLQEECFRLGVDLPDFPAVIENPQTGAKRMRFDTDHGVTRMADWFFEGLIKHNPGMLEHYGMLVFHASWPTEGEKKASSQPSIVTASSNGTAHAPAAPTTPNEGAA